MSNFPLNESVTYFGVTYRLIKKYSGDKYKVKITGDGRLVDNIRIGSLRFDVTKKLNNNHLIIRKRK